MQKSLILSKKDGKEASSGEPYDIARKRFLELKSLNEEDSKMVSAYIRKAGKLERGDELGKFSIFLEGEHKNIETALKILSRRNRERKIKEYAYMLERPYLSKRENFRKKLFVRHAA